jgi:hypothetical protein
MKIRLIKKLIEIVIVLLFVDFELTNAQAQSDFGAYYTHLNSGESFEEYSQTLGSIIQ